MAAELNAPTDAAERRRLCPACGTLYSADTRFCPSDGQVLRDEGSENDWLIGKLIADRYLVERQLGAGGMGVVYLAQHVYMPRRCAIKVLRPEFLTNSEAVGRFAREAQNASRISHPNVAAVYDFGDSAEVMYLAMEFVEGMSLAKVLESGPLSISRAATIVSQVASALKAAHELGIVHRDLKPDNIMLAISGESTDLVKVVDFGIARAVLETGQQVTSSGVAIGTPAYMSPEQMSGLVVDARSDLYSLALVVYVMLTGSLPFGIDRADLPLRYIDPPRLLKELEPSVAWPDALQAVMNRALDPDPTKRQETVQKFVRELIDALRVWRPDEIAVSLSALATLGADVTNAFPPDLIMRWATPHTEHAPLAPTGQRSLRPRSRLVLGVGVAAALGAGAWVAFSGTASLSQTAATQANALDSAAVIPAPANTVQTPLTTPSAPTGRSQPSTRRAPPPERANPRQEKSAVITPADTQTISATRLDSSVNQLLRPIDSITTPDSAPVKAASPMPTTGFVLIGTPAAIGAGFYANGRLIGVLRGLRRYEFPPGTLRLRLSLEGCQDWDSSVTIVAGDTVRIGNRRPQCPP